jgi:hypothetical protein
MEVRPINIETHAGVWKREWRNSFGHLQATGVRIFAGKQFLELATTQSVASGEDGIAEAEEVANANIQDRGDRSYCIDLSNDAARYLMGSLGDYASIWMNWGFDHASSVRSALALERHLTKYGLTPEHDYEITNCTECNHVMRRDHIDDDICQVCS